MLFIDMEMPKCCMDCPLLYDYLYCSVTESKTVLAEMDIKRLADCPLYGMSEPAKKALAAGGEMQ